jgi:hypothetical protein
MDFSSVRDAIRRLPRPSASDISLAVATAVFLAIVLRWQYGEFAAGSFGYHDLTIISDFFSNALVHGRPFWVTDGQLSHLRTHFTPSLVLLIPAFVFAQTQFSLIAVVAVVVCAGIFVHSRDHLASLRRLGVPSVWSAIFVASFFVAFVANRYTLRILSSAHFEPVFVLTAALLLGAVRRASSYRWLLPLLLLALGVRQDAGFFLCFLLLSCLVAPRAWGEVSRVKMLVAAALCFGYVLFASKLILPWLGNDGNTRFWHTWGETWPQVFLAWARSPERVVDAISQSEFAAFNAELYYLPVLNPIAWAANQLPAILFYTADAHDKQHLLYYNSAFLLPGLFLCFSFAQLHLLTLVIRLTERRLRWRTVGFSLVAASFAYVAIAIGMQAQQPDAGNLTFKPVARRDPFATSPLRQLLDCESVHSVAADFGSIVYAPFRLDKYLQQNAMKADLVVVARRLNKHIPFYIKPKQLVREVSADGKYVLAGTRDDYDFYLASRLNCTGEPRLSSR